MDTVVGKQVIENVLMVSSERVTRKGLVFHLTTSKSDNGCEKIEFEGIENSVRNKGKRTKVYYTHLYS